MGEYMTGWYAFGWLFLAVFLFGAFWAIHQYGKGSFADRLRAAFAWAKGKVSGK